MTLISFVCDVCFSTPMTLPCTQRLSSSSTIQKAWSGSLCAQSPWTCTKVQLPVCRQSMLLYKHIEQFNKYLTCRLLCWIYCFIITCVAFSFWPCMFYIWPCFNPSFHIWDFLILTWHQYDECCVLIMEILYS